MNEYHCNECGNEWAGDVPLEEAECPECFAMDCHRIYTEDEDEG